MGDHVVVVERTPIALPVCLEPDLEWRQPIVADEREVPLDEQLADMGVDVFALVENTDEAVYQVRAPHPHEFEVDEAESAL